ncbi:SoLute Carrier family Related [Aphelenchoides fujianensis]|nr:SoLute Carrier family Related [Aphelenchoides fujianensis]
MMASKEKRPSVAPLFVLPPAERPPARCGALELDFPPAAEKRTRAAVGEFLRLVGASWQLRVELVLMALALCDTARPIVTPALLAAKVQRAYETPPNASALQLATFVSRRTVRWDVDCAFVNVPLACVFTLVWGAYADRRGRKLPLLLGVGGMLAGNAVHALVCWRCSDWPLETLYAAALLDGALGGFRLAVGCVHALMADRYGRQRTVRFGDWEEVEGCPRSRVVNATDCTELLSPCPQTTLTIDSLLNQTLQLSTRMIVVYVAAQVGEFAGAQLADVATFAAGEVAALAVVQALLFATALFVHFGVHEEERPVGGCERLSLGELGRAALRSVGEGVRVVRERRPDFPRLLLGVTLACAFVHRLNFSEQRRLFGTYARLPPFRWDTERLALCTTLRPVWQVGGLLFGLFALKRRWAWRDSAVLVVASLSRGADCLLVGVARRSWLLDASPAAGALHALVEPLSAALLAALVAPGQAGRVFAADAVVEHAALLLRTALLQQIFEATLDWWPPCVWFVLAAFSLLTASLYSFVHVVAGRRGLSL